MNQEQTIILCGGAINFLNLTINTSHSHAMIPVNGKPVIGWILDDLLSKNIDNIVIIRRAGDVQLGEFLDRAYQRRIKIKQVALVNNGTIIQSLKAGLDNCNSLRMVRVILGDTLVCDPFEGEANFSYVAEVADSHRWCVTQTDEQENIIGYLDKKEGLTPPNRALCGYYHFSDIEFLKICTRKALLDGKKQLSEVLENYGIRYPMKAVNAKFWYDFGNIDNLVLSRQRLLQGRYFNSLTIDPTLNTISKVSLLNDKLRNELNWYLLLPDKLKVLSPRIINQEQNEDKITINQEYYGYPTLAELFLYSSFHPETWSSIITRLLNIHLEFKKYKGELTKAELSNVYKDKTLDRLHDLETMDPYWSSLLKAPTITHNGEVLQNLSFLLPQIIEKTEEIIDNAEVTILHGDFCFSNILFDINSQISRLIDPRGSFGRIGIYGDPRYDIAKLRHSICSYYDYVVSDLFSLDEHSSGVFETDLFTSTASVKVGPIFDDLVQKIGYNIEEIRFIEGLLFISMLPLHRDKPERQKMMFLTGLKILNKLFVPESSKPIINELA